MCDGDYTIFFPLHSHYKTMGFFFVICDITKNKWSNENIYLRTMCCKLTQNFRSTEYLQILMTFVVLYSREINAAKEFDLVYP